LKKAECKNTTLMVILKPASYAITYLIF